MKKLIILAFVILSIAGCSKKDDTIKDTTRPVILKHEVEQTTIEAGKEISFDIAFSDDIALGQAKLEVHDVSDGHSHGRSMAPFYWETILDLNGQTTFSGHQSVVIPSDATAGIYHFTALVTDKSGNESPVSIVELTITNTGQPVIMLVSPDPEELLQKAAGEAIMLEGSVEDDKDLTEIHIRIIPESGSEVIFEAEIELSGVADQHFDLADVNISNPIVIPAGTESGAYELEIIAVDSDENHTILHIELEVL